MNKMVKICTIISIVSLLLIRYNHATQYGVTCNPANTPAITINGGANIDEGDGRIYDSDLEEALQREEEKLRQYPMPTVAPSVNINPAPGEVKDF